MADFSIAINNSLNLFGLADTDKWNAYNWNAFIWGEGTLDSEQLVDKTITAGSIGSDSAITTIVDFLLSFTNSIGSEADMFSEGLTDGSGYSYVYPDDVTDAESRYFPTYSSQSVASTTWSTATVSTTTWS